MSIEVVDYDELNIFIAIYSIALDYGSFIQLEKNWYNNTFVCCFTRTASAI